MTGERARRCAARLSPLLLTSVAACARRAPSVANPKGPAEREVATLWWAMLWVSVAVTVFVVVMGGWAVVRTRARREEELSRDVPWGDRFILISGLGVSGFILITFFIFSLHSMRTLSRGEAGAPLSITVTGHDWWWEASYPNGAVTANEIHIPVGERVYVHLESADVIHSFWVPELAPKIDLIPGRHNAMWMQADHAGIYKGQCAEFCGLQHAHMLIIVVAEAPPAFRQWEQQMALAAPEPVSAEAKAGEQVFMSNTCIGCHAIRGTRASAALGPDLTHIATRTTIAAGTLPLTPQTLAQWILDPQQIKPGVTMPPTSLTPQETRALVAYLLSLGFGGPS